MSSRRLFSRTSRYLVAAFTAFALGTPLLAHGALLTISQLPLAKSRSADVRPNLMFILDNSGSMGWDYLPDYIDDSSGCKSGSVNASITFTAATNASVSAIRVNPQGSCTTTIANLMDGTTTSSSSTTSTVASRIDDEERGGDGWSIDRSGSTLTIYNTDGAASPMGCELEVVLSSGSLTPLKTTFQPRTATKSCSIGDPPYMSADFNRIYYNPDYVYAPAVTSTGTSMTAQTDLTVNKTDPFRLATTVNNLTSYTETVWCNTNFPSASDISNATNTTSVCRVAKDDYNYPDAVTGYVYSKTRNATPYYFRANVTAYCTDEKRNNCIQTASPSGSYTWPARVRFCKTSSTTDCQERYDIINGYTKPNYMNSTGSAAAYSTIDITAVSNGLSIDTINVDGINIIAGMTITAGATDTTATIATAVANAINSRNTTPEYLACIGTRTADNVCSGAPTTRVTVFPQTAYGGSTALIGTEANGRVVASTAPTLTHTSATGTITISGTSGAPARITALTVGGTSVLSGTVNALTGLDTVTKRNTFATNLAAAITGGGYSATVAGSVVTIIAPTGTGISGNGRAIVVTGGNSSTATVTINDNGAGDTAASITNVKNTSGGTTITSGAVNAAGGTNSSTERDAMATSLASRITLSGYTASATNNVVSIFTSLGTTSTTTPSVTSTPAPPATVPLSTRLTISPSTAFSGSGSWRITSISISSGGSCTYSNANLLTATATASSTTGSGVATSTDSRDNTTDAVNLTAASNVLTLQGIAATSTAANSLMGCTVSVTATRTAGTGQMTIAGLFNGASNSITSTSSPFTWTNVANFITPLTTATAFAGGVASTTTPAFITNGGPLSGGNTVGPIGNTPSNFANGADAVKSFIRYDIVPTFSGPVPHVTCATATAYNEATDCKALGSVHRPGFASYTCTATDDAAICPVSGQKKWTLTAGGTSGQFPRSSGRLDCANADYCTYAEEATNFGNWYSYYRTRMLSMKTAAGTAFSGIGDNFRVGFVTIGNHSSGDGSGSFLAVDDFGTTQKTNWFSKLYAQTQPNATPLRHALSSVGRYFAGKNPYSFTSVDPMQYACQQNFALLTTDGYWNEDWDSGIKQVNGTTMGNFDNVTADVPRPYYDGGLGGTCGVGGNVSGASSCGTLSDIAYHYYATDLRTTALATNPPSSTCKGSAVAGVQYDVCENLVKGGGDDNVAWQHMTTYTLGLGVDGTLEFRDDYKTAGTGDFEAIKSGTKNWPQAQNLHPTAVDDLWHAAVNGRGTYFSAKNPANLARDLRDALTGIGAQVGSGAAAATSNLEPSDGDNYSYVASYTSAYWYGNLEARTINVVSGQTQEQALWCIEDVAARPDKGTTACTGTLKSKVNDFSDTRKIYLFDSSGTNKLRDFTYDNLSLTEKTYFDPTTLPQYGALAVTTKALATGTTLVNYLRGQWGYEDQSSNVDRIYRDRKATFGDPVGSQPIFVRRPVFYYSDPGYAGFKTANVDRESTVFIGTNDGMLHAFNGDTGQERWSYIPSVMLPNMKQLADANYGGDTHRYFVDGSPTVNDVCVADCNGTTPDWRTVMIVGYGGGGKGFTAIDVTNPDTPKGMWEISSTTDSDMGYSFGNPIVTKRSDGTWVALLTSGYNNVGTGKGYLFVVDVASGTILKKISTGMGDTTTPSGLSKIESYIADANNNTTRHVYGGDLLGNVWRFTIDKDFETAVRVAVVEDSTGTPQPITTRPLITELDDADKTRYIIVGTGKLVEQGDLLATDTQSMYAFVEKYDLTTEAVGNCGDCTLGARDQLTQESLVPGVPDAKGRPTRIAGSPSVEPPASRKVQGCFVDFPLSGERVNVDMKLVRGVISAITNVPKSGACVAGGESYINFLDYKTCKSIDSYKIGDALAVGIVVLKLASGYVVTATLSDSPTPELVGSVPPPVTPTSSAFGGRRVGWRLLYD
jgi:type IV pilus assembly protein PilY1